jgi:hypothetical protein
VNIGRTGGVALALVAVSAPLAFAAASWEKGDYAGRTQGKYFTSQGKLRQARISLRIKRHRVTDIHYEMRVLCADGNRSSFVVEPAGFLPLDKNGKFSGSAPSPGGTGEDRISGQVSGAKASGTVRSFDREDANHNESSKGVKCDSGRVKWSAKKK